MPLFRFTLTSKATEKDVFEVTEVDAELFIRNMLKRGHRVSSTKDGSGIIAATFAAGGRLEQKYVETITGLILDVDGKFRRNGELVNEAIAPDWFLSKLPYRGVAHTSYNHTPEQPKYRVILPLAEPITPEEFHRLWAYMFERVEKKCDPSCKNPDRMFFLPRCRPEAAADKWPWMRELQGPYLSMDVVPADFQPEERYQSAGPRKKQGAHTAPVAYRRGRVDTHQLLECLMDLPVYKWAIENPAVISREVWRGLATNIAAAVLEDENAYEEGSKAFHALSEVDGERYDYGVTEKTFRDALKSAQHPGPMTYARLVENGAPQELEKSLHKSPIADARNRLWRQERESPKTVAPPETHAHQPLPEGAQNPGLVSSEPAYEDDGGADGHDETKAVSNGKDPDPEDFVFNIETAKWMQKGTNGVWTQEFPGESLTQILLPVLPRKQHDAFKSRIPKFHTKEPVYSTQEQLVYRDGLIVFNTYKPSTLLPIPGQYGDHRDWPDIHLVWLNIAGNDQGAYEYLLDWSAVPLQSLRFKGEPYKQGSSPVLAGEQGSGKGAASEMLALMYGESNYTTIGQELLDGRFNETLIGKLFVNANEVMSSSNRSAQTANKIKPWVTDYTIPLEGKFQTAKNVKNNFNIWFTSNDWRPVMVEREDRRFSVFYSTKLDEDVGRRVYADIRGARTQLCAFYDFLLKRQTKIKWGELYKTEARKALIAASDPSDTQFAMAIKEDGWLNVSAHWVESAPNGKIREAVFPGNYVSSETVYEVYLDYCRQHGVKPFTRNKTMRTLKQVFPGAESFKKRFGALTPMVWDNLPMQAPDANIIDLAEKAKEKERAATVDVEVPDVGA